MSNLVKNALLDFFQRHAQLFGDNQHAKIEHDPDWLSPCQLGSAKEGKINWLPFERKPTETLDNLNSALSLTIHPDVVAFYTTFYAATVDAKWQENELSLIQVWNDEDFKLLQENILGHLMMKQKLKQQATTFIATTYDDEYLISVLNKTGEVMLERVGKEPERLLASNLAEFIQQLTPIIQSEDSED